MASPTILEVKPARGVTGGQALVEVLGTGFQLPQPPQLGPGETPAPPPSVRVFFGGVEARRVRVISAERLLVTTPPHAKGVVSVEVRNVNEYGDAVAGGAMVAAGLFTYVMPELAKDSIVTRVVRRLMDELMVQVYPECVRTQSVDWSDTPDSALRKVATAKVPSLVLAGPTIREDMVRRTAVPTLEQLPGGEVREFRSPDTVDLIFTLGAIANSTIHLDGLATSLRNFVKRNPWLTIPRSTRDATRGEVRYEVGFEPNGDMVLSTEPNASNLKSCATTIVVRGVLLEGLGLEGDMGVDVHPQMTEAPRVTSRRD